MKRTPKEQRFYDDAYGFIAGANRTGLIYAAWGFLSSAVESGALEPSELKATSAGLNKALKDRGVNV